jgi:hypothetical protein
MTMPVTDESVATLRALLAGESKEYERLYAQLDPIAKRTGYLPMIDVALPQHIAGTDDIARAGVCRAKSLSSSCVTWAFTSR